MERSGVKTTFTTTVRLFFILASFAFAFLGSCGTFAETTTAAAAVGDGASAPETFALRSRRHAADQRMAEIQALLALGKMKGGGDELRMVYGHGLVDPHNVGRRNRLEPNRERNSIESQQIDDQRMDLNDNLLLEESK